MKKIVLHPLKGIEFENNEVLEFGTSKLELIKRFGNATSEYDQQLFYDDLELRIDLDNEDKIEFIEFIYGPYPEKVEIEIYGINPFKTDSAALIELLSSHNKGEVDENEEPYCYAFLESSIGIFRDSCEVDMDEMLKEMKEIGAFAENEKWVLEDLEKAKYFWTVGLGKKEYYK